MKSIERRLMVTIIIGALLVPLEILVVSLTLHALHERNAFDELLRHYAAGVAESLYQEDDTFYIDDEVFEDWYDFEDDGLFYAQVWTPEGDELLRSPSMPYDLDLPQEAGSFLEPAFINLDLDLAPDFDDEHAFEFEGIPDRAVGIRVFLPFDRDLIEDFHHHHEHDEDEDFADEDFEETAFEDQAFEGAAFEDEDFEDAFFEDRQEVIVVVAGPREKLELWITDVSLLLALLALGGTILVCLLAMIWIRQGLKPLKTLHEQLTAIDAENPKLAMDAADTPRELKPVVTTIQSLLQQLDAALDRERRITSAIAHELRTPVAELKALSEVSGRDPSDTELAKQTVQEAHGIAGQMDRLINALLDWHRARAATETTGGPPMQPVLLRSVLDDAWQRVESAARSGEQTADFTVAPDLTVVCPAEPLTVILSNLLTNAVTHSVAGSAIRLLASSDGNRVLVRIENRAEGLSVKDLPRLTEPFWRGDASRTDGQHSGLGLAIAEELCQSMGAELGFEVAGDVFVATVTVGDFQKGD